MHTDSTDSWSDIVQRVREDLPELVDAFLEQFHDSGYYREDSVDDAEVRSTASSILGLFLVQLEYGMDEDSLAAHARQLGTKRAHQGVRLSALVDAIQIDFTVLWDHFRATVTSEQLSLLVEHVADIQRLVSRYTVHIRGAYAAEQARARHDARFAHARHIERLFSAEHLGEQAMGAISRALGIAEGTAIDLVVFHPSEWAPAQTVLEPLAVRGEIYGHGYHGLYAAFFPASKHAWDFIRDHTDHLGAVTFNQLPNLAAVRAAVRASVTMFDAAENPGRLIPVEDVAWALAAQQVHPLLPAQLHAAHAGVVELRKSAPDVVETVGAYLKSGSTKDVATLLHCHRNTVVNRLQSFKAQTGLDVTVPSQAALALAALPWKGATPAAPAPAPQSH